MRTLNKIEHFHNLLRTMSDFDSESCLMYAIYRFLREDKGLHIKFVSSDSEDLDSPDVESNLPF